MAVFVPFNAVGTSLQLEPHERRRKMKNTWRKILGLVLVVALLGTSVTVFATETNEQVGFTVEVPIFEPIVSDPVSPRAHDVEYKSELVGTTTKTKVYIGPAGGQPSNGSVLPAGSSFIWTDGGYETEISISISWGVFSVSISPGSIGGSTGYSIAAMANKACKLYIYKDITTYKYANYERLIGTSTWRLTGYRYGHAATRNYFEVRAV